MDDLSNDYSIEFSRTSLLVMIILFSLLIVYIIMVGVEKVVSSIFRANLMILGFAMILYYSSLLVRSLRWKIFLKSLTFQTEENISYLNIYSLIAFSFALNNLFPLRMGELYRPYEFSKRYNYTVISSFATVILERTFDVVFMGALIIVTATLHGLGTMINTSEIFGNILFSLGIILGFIILLLILSKEETTFFVVRILNALSGLVQKKIIKDEEQTAQRVAKEVSTLIWNRRIIFFGCLLSFIIWTMEGFVFWTVAMSMNIEIPLLMAIFILLLAGLIGNSITSASGLSQLPFMVAQLILFLGISQDLALSLSLVYLLIVFWLIVPIGTLLRELERFLFKKELEFDEIV
ncbi:MAG: lysylphosphatidylglycerol synthase transmembrane domain-containing protein [Candidatus Hodarchaeota archaeon]